MDMDLARGPVKTGSSTTKSSNVVLFNACKKELYVPTSGYKKFARKLRSQYTVEMNKDDISLERMKKANIVIFSNPRDRFSTAEFEHINTYVNEGGSVLFLMGDSDKRGKDTNVNSFLQESYGISYNNDSVIRTVYYKYLHPKEVFISNGIVNREIARVALATNSQDKGTFVNNNNPAEVTAFDHKGLDFVYPYGTTLEIKAPAIPILSTGYISYPMNRPIGAVWQHPERLEDHHHPSSSSSSSSHSSKHNNQHDSDEVDHLDNKTTHNRGRVAVLGSSDIFADAWLEKEENAKLMDILLKWLNHDPDIELDARDAQEPDVAEPNLLPDTEALSERLRSCLQESEELPRDFTKLFDTELFQYDIKLIPESVKAHKHMGLKVEPLSLIPPQFETPLPSLRPAVFPPILREPPPPALDQFDLDEHFASEQLRLAQLTNKCTDNDLEYYIKESGEIMGITQELAEDQRGDARYVLEYLFRRILSYKKLNQDVRKPPLSEAKQHESFSNNQELLMLDHKGYGAEAKSDPTQYFEAESKH